ncbi:MAG TPA: cyclase family protein [Amycolatopsis sp.]|nr:cyclase family protein [Amycolatopsis sp.]
MPDFRAVGARVRNWGRWGADDEIGTLNFLTSERVAAAARLVRSGLRYDLGIPLDDRGPQTGRRRTNPLRFMRALGPEQVGDHAFRYADDYVFMPLQAGSQWDALAHVYYDDLMYNGRPATETLSVAGAAHLSIDRIRGGIVGRGVLLDVARHLDTGWLDAGQPITPELLDEVVSAQGVPVGEGDILAIRTGWRRKFVEEADPDSFMAGEPGLTVECAYWLHEHGVAAVCSDNWAIEVLPTGVDERLPFHLVAIRDMGLTLGEMFDFEALSAQCAAERRFEFFFSGAPLRFTGAVGSPVNPIALL